MPRHIVLGQIGMNNEAWLWCPDKLRSGNVIQLAFDTNSLALETDGGVEVGILWGINGSLFLLIITNSVEN